MNLPYIERIWRISGSLPLEAQPGPWRRYSTSSIRCSRPSGTSRSIAGDTLAFTKKNPLAQDKMSVFDRGQLKVGDAALTYWMTSKALLFCFLAPLLFLGFGQLTIVVGKIQKPTAEEAKKAEEKAKKDEEEKAAKPLNPIDKFLGAPAPDKPEGRRKEEGQGERQGKGPGALAHARLCLRGLFAALYLLGRWLEPWLIRREFRRRLEGAPLPEGETSLAKQ